MTNVSLLLIEFKCGNLHFLQYSHIYHKLLTFQSIVTANKKKIYKHDTSHFVWSWSASRKGVNVASRRIAPSVAAEEEVEEATYHIPVMHTHNEAHNIIITTLRPYEHFYIIMTKVSRLWNAFLLHSIISLGGWTDSWSGWCYRTDHLSTKTNNRVMHRCDGWIFGSEIYGCFAMDERNLRFHLLLTVFGDYH